MRADRDGFGGGQLHDLGQERTLGGDLAGLELPLQALEQHPLVRGVLIHDLHLIADLGDQVPVGDLPQRPYLLLVYRRQIRLPQLRHSLQARLSSGQHIWRRVGMPGHIAGAVRCNRMVVSLRQRPRRHHGRPGGDGRGFYRSLDPRADPLMHLFLIRKAHFALRRVDVHIHLPRIHPERQDEAGLVPPGQVCSVAFVDGVHDRGVLHPTAVHEQILGRPGERRLQRAGAEPFQTEPAGFLPQTHGGIHQFRAIHLLHAIPQSGNHGIVRHRMAVVRQPEVDVRKRQRLPLHHLADMPELRGGALEKLLTGGGVVEQVRHFDRGAGSRRRLPLLVQRAALEPDLRAHRGAGRDRDEPHLGHRRDAGQGFAAKAHGLDGEEVGLGADLARGMALERERRLLRRHALPVVRHPDGAPPGLLNVHRHASGPGVDGVLHQFLHHGGGPLDDFAGGDLVDDVAREDRDPGRH